MPTYEYRCTACDARLEVVQRFTDEPLTTCEGCGGTLKRVFHPVGVVLKGSGFYATDNRSGKPPRDPSKTESSVKTESSTKTESSSSSGSKPVDKKKGSAPTKPAEKS